MTQFGQMTPYLVRPSFPLWCINSLSSQQKGVLLKHLGYRPRMVPLLPYLKRENVQKAPLRKPLHRALPARTRPIKRHVWLPLKPACELDPKTSRPANQNPPQNTRTHFHLHTAWSRPKPRRLPPKQPQTSDKKRLLHGTVSSVCPLPKSPTLARAPPHPRNARLPLRTKDRTYTTITVKPLRPRY